MMAAKKYKSSRSKESYHTINEKSGFLKKMPVWFQAFLINFAIAAITILPSIIQGNGLFALSNDYNAQEIPFNMLLNDSIKEGSFLWNWGIDLGGNMLEAFGFYNVGSLFTWITFLFPSEVIPYVLGWMLMIKFAIAGMTSALYLKRYLKSGYAVIFASILYAFSGYQCTNIVFYHFHDVVAFFPLLLVGLDELVENNRKGVFALAVALNCLCNYIFFFGEIIFLIIYYVNRYLIAQIKQRDIKVVIYKILQCMIEGIIGILISGVLLIPGIVYITTNSRASNHLPVGQWFLMDPRSWLMVLKAFLLPADPMNGYSVVADSNWYSNALYLPIIGMVFVFAYILRNRDWLTSLIITSLIFICIPVLNSLFVFLNVEAYRRWFYMPVMFFALCSGKILEAIGFYKKSINSSLVINGIVLTVFVLIVTVLWNENGQDLIYDWNKFVFGVVIAAAGYICIFLFNNILGQNKARQLLKITALESVLLLSYMIFGYQSSIDNTYINFSGWGKSRSENVVGYLTEIPRLLNKDILPYRYYFDEGIGYTYYNLGMTNTLPTTNSFISTAHSSITELYDSLGLGRGTMTLRGPEELKALFSVKYTIANGGYYPYSPTTTITDSSGHAWFIYEDIETLPIGFTYDSYMPKSEFLKLSIEDRAKVMLETLVVKDEDVEKVSSILEAFNFENDHNTDTSMIMEEKECSTDFVEENNYFASQIDAEEATYAFFSVPYDRFWNAKVNGNDTEILDINGLMAVRIDEGLNNIEFSYEYIPFYIGAISTICGSLALAFYALGYPRVVSKRNNKKSL